jgi:SecD/SecF fusion protein
MRNKGFFWFFTILLAIVSIYQISFTFVSSNVEGDAEQLAEEKARELIEANKELDSILLPNDTWVQSDDIEAFDLAKAAYLNELLKERSEDKVFLGNSYKEIKEKSISLGLDLKGGMSVTLELSMSDLVANAALNPRDLHFRKPFDKAVDEYNSAGGDFIDLFVKHHNEIYPDRKLIREFSTEEVVSQIGNKATDEEVTEFLRGLSDGALEGVETIMTNRINQFGVAQPNITQDLERNRLYIELPGVKDQATVRERLQSTANLEFFLAYKGTELGGFFNELMVEDEEDVSLEDLYGSDEDETEENDDTVEEDENAEGADEKSDSLNNEDEASDENEELSLDDLMDEDSLTTEDDEEEVKLSEFAEKFQLNIVDGQYTESPQLGFAKAADTARLNELLLRQSEEMMLENARFYWSSSELRFTDNDTLYYSLYALKIPEDGKARVGGSDIDKARVSVDPEDGSIGVSVSMNARGTEEWGEMTAENVNNFIAITMDNKVFSAPVIRTAIRGGETLISGGFTSEEAKGLSNLLNAGALPAPCVIIDEAVVGPTIGAENSRAGLISFGIALALVLIYMIFYYGKAGVVADIALITNIIFIVGFLAAFGAVLTLAGIAGIVLTIGMSVDANVLIYERIREEVAEGKGMKLAISDGYKKALSSIIDANVTTLLTAIVLKTFGTGPIESFATTLMIGIFTSVFAAVVITRLIFEWRLNKKATFNFSTKITEGAFKNFSIQFVKNRKKFYIISGLLVVGGLVMIFTRGLKPSVEFSGGRTYETVFDQNVSDKIEDIDKALRASLKNEDNSSASVEVKKRNSDFRVEIATDYLQNVPGSEATVREKIEKALSDESASFGNPIIENSRSVSPTISKELQKSSLISIILSLIIIFAYILIRFGTWQYGLGALLAMGHDVIIVLGLFALLHGLLPFNMEIDQAFIAAILTVVGYSINDTVVVFDRIREYLIKYRRKDRKTVINEALNSTLSRTINTSVSTFVVLLTIFIFDGGAIKGFVFALMIGVIVGTYSSLCIATPAVVDLGKDDNEEK